MRASEVAHCAFAKLRYRHHNRSAMSTTDTQLLKFIGLSMRSCFIALGILDVDVMQGYRNFYTAW